MSRISRVALWLTIRQFIRFSMPAAALSGLRSRSPVKIIQGIGDTKFRIDYSPDIPELFIRCLTGVVLLLMLFFNSSVVQAAAPVMTISAGGTVFVEDGAAVAVDPLLTVTGSTLIDGATVAITDGYVSTEDRLVYTTTSGIGGSFDTASGILTLTGSASPADYQAALRAVQYQNTNSATPNTGARTIRYALGSSLSFYENGHFYEFVTASGISWTAARDAAATRTLFGLQGYLTTVTSANENSFIVSKLVGQGWMGASDATVENDWRWVTGPEAGTPFWSGTATGSAVGGEYNNWSTGEPNDFGSGEDYAHFLTSGAWNDYPHSLSSINGYVVEYGGMPGDPVLQITGNKSITVSARNDSPTGAVTISGTPVEGQTLTASNTLADVDGLGVISYRWNRAGSAINGATNSTYLLTQSDVGQVLTVTASYTDNGGTAESVTSNATAAVANVNDAPTGSVTVGGTATQGQILTATNTLADADGLGAISYQWYRGGNIINGATNSTYLLTQSDVGQVLAVTASYTDNGGTAESVTSSATAAVTNVNDAPTGSVTISGIPTEGQTLTASNTLADADGLGTISYQWNRAGSAINGATNSTYLLTQSDVGQILTVTASYTDNGATAENIISSATAAVANVNDAPTGSVTVSGTPTEGQTLTAGNTLADVDGLGTIGYQWNRAGNAIDGATNGTYLLTQADVGQPLTVTASYIDGEGTAESVTSSATTAVVNVNDAPTGSVTISGIPTEGQTLTASNTLADIDGLGEISYQWNQAGSAISGATNSTYLPTQADVGKLLTVTASYTDGEGTVESVTSSATAAVTNVNNTPTGGVIISGTSTEGQVLTASNTLADIDGLGVISYQWNRGGSAISGATGNSYMPGAADVGQMLTVTARYTDTNGTTESVTSAATAVIDSDRDGDGTGDGSDTDIDGDGMSNTYEDANGLDKYDSADRDGDLDNDGISNYDESVAGSGANTDDYPPSITAPADIFVDATGLFTEVALGTATASDSRDGPVAVTLTHLNGDVVTTPPTHFQPGVHTVTWTASDAANNSTTAIQTIHVTPLVEFSKDQISSEGSVARFKVILNGPAVSYPVTVPYTVEGTASTDGTDHDLADGTVTINSPDLETTVTVNLVDDGAGEGSETLLVTMGTPVNAVAGHVASHRIEILEGNVAPVVVLHADQGGSITRIVSQGNGNAVVTADVTDANAGDSFSFDWSASDSALADIDSSEATFEFNPANLTPGVYTVAVSVSDGVEQIYSEVKLNVVAKPPAIASGDSDGDGVSDELEGYGDSDGDGVPDFLDHSGIARNVIQEQVTTETRFLMETEPGLELSLGTVAFQTGGGKTTVGESEIQELANNGAGAAADEGHTFNNGLFDFVVDKLPVAGQSVDIVIAQFAPIPADAIYRKLMPEGWQDFIEDNKNSISSAAGAEGYCPPPNSPAYTTGLTEGHWCVQLTIEDGGPNDADRLVNQSVNDPGGVAVAAAPEAENPPLRTGVDGMGGCTLGSGNSVTFDPVLPLLFILSLLYLMRGKAQLLLAKRISNTKKHKKLLVAGIGSISCLLCLSVVQAEPVFNKSWYLGLGAGISNLEPDTTGTGYRIDSSQDTGGKLFFGYDFSRRFSLEGYYSRLGEAELAPSGWMKYEDSGLSGLYYFFKQNHPHLGWEGFGRLGLGWMKNDSDLNYIQENNRHLLLGAGIEYGFSNGFAVRVDVDLYDKDARLVALNLLKRFGGSGDKKTIAAPVAIQDSDHDGVADTKDACPDTPAGANVDDNGCERDGDGDGVTDNNDRCPDTESGTPVDAHGCDIDSDNDGVSNGLDHCPSTASGVTVDAQGCELKLVFNNITFATNSVELTADSVKTLNEIADTLRSHPELKIELAGHADSRGRKKYNLDLSQRRAEAAHDYLAEHGVSVDQLMTKAYGSDRPVADNATPEGRADNRRVEIHVFD